MIRETGNSITDLDYARQKIVIYKIYLYIQKETIATIELYTHIQGM